MPWFICSLGASRLGTSLTNHVLELAFGVLQEMELGSHPDLESVSEDVMLTSDVAVLESKEAASPTASLDRTRCSMESHKNLRRMLLKTMSNDEVSVYSSF